MPFGGLLTVGLISAGTGLLGGGLAAHSANKAAKTQQQSAADALALQRDMYNQQVQLLEPYRAQGQAALGTLAQMLAPALASGKYAATSRFVHPNGPAPALPPLTMANLTGPYQPPTPLAGPSTQAPAPTPRAPGGNNLAAFAGPAAPPPGAPAAGPRLYSVQAPTGQVKHGLDEASARHYVQLGARIVG